jgi:hypothetical protein
MSAATRIFRRTARRTVTKLMDKVGKRLVSGMADTSSDAPNAAYAPKRDLYSKMKDGTAGGAHDHDHDHDHDD